MESGADRKSAIDRLASPEQLDQLMTITRPRGWMALAVLWLMLGVGVAWGIFGRIPQKVSGRGIIIREGGILDVVSLGSGQIEEILVRPGQKIERDQIVARVRELDAARQSSVDVRSTLSGTVVEIRTAPGLLVTPGVAILTVERDDTPILAVVYIDAADGKKVQRGMPIQIAPATVKKEVDGFMLGTVESVSSFPASREGMMALLQNESLVDELSAQGPPIAISARLTTNPNTASGFRWSSGKGPATKITAGTPCTASVVVEEMAPVHLVIPALRDDVGM